MKIVVRLLNIIGLLIGSIQAHALDNPAQFNFDGVLLDGSNNPITAATSVTFQIYNPAANCLLFEETQTVTPDSAGAFSVPVGSGTRVSPGADGGQSWKTILSNKGVVRSAGTNCASGYTPATNDGRKLRVTVGSTVLSPDFSISSTPMATSADTLQGYQPSDFLSNLGGSLVGFLKMDSQNEVRFADSGNTNYIALKAPGTVTTSYSLALPTADGTNGQMLITNGSGQLSWSTPGGGGLPLAGGTMTGSIAMGGNNITATGHITMSPQTTLNLGTYTDVQQTTLVGGLSGADTGKTWFNSTTGTMMVWDGTTAQAVSTGAGITALTGDVAAAGPGSVAATISANAVTSGKIANDSILTSKIKSAGGGVNRLLITDGSTGSNVIFADTCANGEILKWNTGTGWACSAQLPSSAIVQGGNSLAAGMSIGTNDNYGLVLQTNAISRMTLTTSGNVGINSSAPASALDVVAGGTPAELASFTGSNAAGTGLKIRNTNSVNAYSNVQFWSGAAEQWEIGGSSSDFYIYDAIAGQNRVTINNAGNVGVGTTLPNAKLEVFGGDALINGLAVGRGQNNLSSNSAFGVSALSSTTGNYNTGIGYWALKMNTSGTDNSAVGVESLKSNTTGATNSAFGRAALAFNATGTGNTALGWQAIYSSTAANNVTAVGRNALYSATAPSNSTAVGANAGTAVTSGAGNVFLGYNAGSAVTTGNYNVVIGSNAGAATMSNTIILADGQGNERLRADSSGNVGVGTTTPSEKLHVNGNVKVSGDLSLGNSAGGCAAGNEGAIRYNGTPKVIEMCDGAGNWLAVPMRSVLLYAGNSLNASLTASSNYISQLVGSSTMASGAYTQAATSNLVTRAGVLRNLRIQVGPGAAGTWTFTIIKGTGTTTYTSTSLTCTFSSGTTCSDSANTVVVNPGDEIGIQVATGSSTGSAKVSWAVELEAP